MIINKQSTITCFILVFGLFFYYLWCASNLPKYAGPDEKSTELTASFYAEHQRLAKLPKDKDLLWWSKDGHNRIIRAQFSYLFGGVTKAISNNEVYGYRLSSIISMTLVSAVMFYSCLIMTRSLTISALTSVLFSTIPQYVFLASYFNDDSGAILAGALLILFLSYFYQKGITNTSFLFAAACLGLTVINKQTAYANLIVLFIVFIVKFKQVISINLRWWLLGFFVFVIFGGWWVINNMLTYGINDPILWKIKHTMIELTKVQESPLQGTRALYGLGFIDIITRYDYWYGLGLSFVGYLGKLEIRILPYHYIFYWFVLLSSVVFLIVKMMLEIWVILTNKLSIEKTFYVWLFISLLITYYLYLHFIVNYDVQIQGKYLMPVISGLAVCFAMLLSSLKYKKISLSILAVLVTMSLLINYESIRYRVKPFYFPDNIIVRFDRIASEQLFEDWLTVNQANFDKNQNNSYQLNAKNNDPQLIWDERLCAYVGDNFRVLLNIDSPINSSTQLFVDDGTGFREPFSQSRVIIKGNNDIIFDISLGGTECLKIRLDPIQTKANIEIKKLQFEAIKIKKVQ